MLTGYHACLCLAEHKLTISTNRPAPPLLALCEDMLLHSTMAASISRTTAANVMSFELRAGGTVTILVSKTGGRYRLQSDRFAALWLLVQVCGLCRNVHCSCCHAHSLNCDVAAPFHLFRAHATSLCISTRSCTCHSASALYPFGILSFNS